MLDQGIERLLELSASFEAVAEREVKKLPTLRGRTVLSVFFEASTRTSSSFELAAKRLSADTISLKSSGSSVEKGETLKDTLLTLDAYGPDVVVIRHAQVGAAALATHYTRASVVNAGDGAHQHPTQSLLDLYAMRAALGRRRGSARSRSSATCCTRAWPARTWRCCSPAAAHVTLIGPPSLIPRGIEATGVSVSHDIADIAAADVVYVLRMQRERMLPGEAYVPNLREYTLRWGINAERLRPGQVVMHPGPMNRGVEISDEVADSAASLVTQQVRAGLVVRMAVLYDVLAGGEAAA